MQVNGITGAQRAPSPQPRLVHAAHEFEGQMLKELLKPMASGGNIDGDEDGSLMGDFASEALGKALSEQGGFGLADRIVRQLDRSGNHPETKAVTGKEHFDTGISNHKSLQ